MPKKILPFEGVGKDNLVTFSTAACLNDIGEEMYAPYLSYFALTFLGVTPLQYGLIEGITEGVNRILRFFTGAFSDQIGRRMPVVLGYILIALSRLGLPMVRNWVGFLPIRGLRQVGRSLRDPAREASIAESVPETLRGRAFGLLETVDTVGAAIGPILGLFILTMVTSGQIRFILTIHGSRTAYLWLFMWASVPTILSAFIIWFFLQETKRFARQHQAFPTEPGKRAAEQGSIRLWQGLRIFIRQRALFRITLAHMVLALGAVPVPMILYYAYKELKANELQGAILFISYAIAHFLSSYPSGWMVDKLGRFWSQAIGNLICGVALLLVILVPSPLLMVIPMVLYGIFEAIWVTARRAIIADLAYIRIRAQTLGTFSAFYGLAALVSPILLGWVWQQVTPRLAFLLASLICGGSIFILRSGFRRIPWPGT